MHPWSATHLTLHPVVQGHEFERAAAVLKLLQGIPASEAEWILYMDPQTMFDAPTETFNFEFYAGRDLVVACDIWKLKSGDTGTSDRMQCNYGMCSCHT